jgi:hypothetical protein
MTLTLAERRPLERLALVVWTTALCGCGFALITAICWFSVPPITHDPAFIARFAVLDGFLYPRQPGKTAAFQACVVAAPFLIFGAVWIVRRVLASLSGLGVKRAVYAGLAIHLLFFAACMRPLFYYPNPPLWLAPSWLLCPMTFPPPVPEWEWIGCVFLALALGFVVTAGLPTGPVRRFVVRLVVVLAVLLAPLEFYLPSQVTDDTAFTYHLNAMLDALSQSIDGHHLLVDFPHIYGGYGEMLAPVLRLFPRAMAVPLVALAVPTGLGIGFWLLAAFRLIRHPAVLALGATAILGVTYLSALPPNYCYGTPRTLFPSLGLLLVISYLRRPAAALFWIISVIAAIAPVWNLDTGLVLWFAWTLTLLAGDAARCGWMRAMGHGAAQLALLAAVWAAFFLYLRLASHEAPNLGLLFYFQSMVVKTGYFCVAMIAPSAWTFVVLLFVTGLVVSTLAHLRRRLPWKGRVVLFLSLLSIGMFSYYMGRSAESNLISVSPPAILLAGMMGSEALSRIRRGILPPVTRWFFVPWAAMIFWWAFLFFVQLPVILQREVQLAGEAIHPAPSFVQTNADFAAQQVRPGEAGVFFLSGHSGFYYYLTGTTRTLRIPGNVELLQMRDMNVLIQDIEARQIPKLFVERNFWTMDMYRPDVYQALTDAIKLHYRAAASSPGGRLVLYEPVPDKGLTVTFSLPNRIFW